MHLAASVLIRTDFRCNTHCCIFSISISTIQYHRVIFASQWCINPFPPTAQMQPNCCNIQHSMTTGVPWQSLFGCCTQHPQWCIRTHGACRNLTVATLNVHVRYTTWQSLFGPFLVLTCCTLHHSDASDAPRLSQPNYCNTQYPALYLQLTIPFGLLHHVRLPHFLHIWTFVDASIQIHTLCCNPSAC